MKKNLYIGIAALAALTLSSCQREADFKVGPDMVTVTLTADKAGDATRAAAVEGDNKVTYEWTDEDIANLKLFKVTTTTTTGTDGKETIVETLTPVDGVNTSVSTDNRVLSITATVEANSTLRAIVSSDWTSSETDPKPRLIATQNPATDNFDPNADILVADDVTVSELTDAKLDFVRPVTVNKMILKGLTNGEKVSKVVLTSDMYLTGYCKYDEDRTMSGQKKELTILYENATVGSNGEFPVYFVTMPNAGHTLLVAVETVKNSKDWRYTKTLASTVDFVDGKFTRFGVNLTGCGKEVVDVNYSGEWVIGGTSGTTALAATSYTTGNFYPVNEVTIEDDVVTVPSSPESYKMTITRITSGDNAGFYTIVDAGGKYLSAKTDGNYMNGLDEPSDNSYWSIAENADGTYTILAANVTGDVAKLMCVNFSSPRVTCYKENTTQKKVTLYPYDKVKVAVPPTTGFQFQKVSAVTSGKQYLIVANDGSKLHAAKPITSGYGYPGQDEVTDVNGIITLAAMTNAFTFTSETGGYTIKQSDDRFWYMKGSYNNFNVDANPTEGQYFAFAKNDDGTFKVTNVAMNKYLQYSVDHTSYGCYSDAQGVMPYLYEYIGQSGNTPTTFSITIASGIQNGTVTASMTSNIEEGESITITVTPATGYELGTLTVDGANVTSEVVDSKYIFDMPGHDVAVSATFKSTGTATYDFTTVAQLNALVTTTSATYKGKLTNAVVSFVPAANTAIIKDATGSIMYYKSAHGLKQGQTFTGDITVKAIQYNGLYSEITDLGSAAFSGDEAVVEPETVTIANLVGQYNKYQNAYVKVENLTVVNKDGKNINVTDGTNNYVVFDNVGSVAAKAGDILTVATGTVTKYSTTEEIKAWKAADITITSSGTGGETGTYTLDGTLTGGSNGYATESEITQNDITWMVEGNTTASPWRIGGKSITEVDREIYSTTKLEMDVEKIEITHGTANDITVNSMTVVVASDAAFSTVVSTLTPTFAANSTVTVNKPAGASWNNCYYKIVYNVTVTESSNKFIQFTSAKFTGN